MESFDKLRSKYEDFKVPKAQVVVGGKDISSDKEGLSVSDISVDLTSGFEASVAEFTIYNIYDPIYHEYQTNKVKKYITIGSPVEISLGYDFQLTKVFNGFVSEVVFVLRQGEVPGIEVHAMDIKGIMMANDYAKQIAAESYSEAVKAIFDQSFYQKLKGDGNVFSKLKITDTPDKKPGGGKKKEATDRSIEMVNESDYEFVVRAAKRYNFEFFQLLDTIYFRKAKSDQAKLIELNPYDGIITFEIGYNVTGLAGKIEVRNTDPSKGKLVKYALKLDGKISESGKAKGLVGKQNKIYIDPTASTQQEAEYRARYLKEDMSYRYGTMELDMIGLPEMVPGKFVSIEGLGKSVSNKFYLYSVRHSAGDGMFKTHLTGKAEGLPSLALPF